MSDLSVDDKNAIANITSARTSDFYSSSFSRKNATSGIFFRRHHPISAPDSDRSSSDAIGWRLGGNQQSSHSSVNG